MMMYFSLKVAAKKQTLKNVTDYITDVICKRAEHGYKYGVILIPEGLIDFIPEVYTPMNKFCMPYRYFWLLLIFKLPYQSMKEKSWISFDIIVSFLAGATTDCRAEWNPRWWYCWWRWIVEKETREPITPAFRISTTSDSGAITTGTRSTWKRAGIHVIGSIIRLLIHKIKGELQQ